MSVGIDITDASRDLIISVGHIHCRQRAPIENAWSTSGIFYSGIFKQDTDNYRKYL